MQENRLKEIIRRIVESYELPRDAAEELLKEILEILQKKKSGCADTDPRK